MATSVSWPSPWKRGKLLFVDEFVETTRPGRLFITFGRSGTFRSWISAWEGADAGPEEMLNFAALPAAVACVRPMTCRFESEDSVSWTSTVSDEPAAATTSAD